MSYGDDPGIRGFRMTDCRRVRATNLGQVGMIAVTMVAIVLMAALVGCGESEPAVPNSENGVFFVDNQYGIASGWKSDITLVGPQTAEQACDAATGVCGFEHTPLKIIDVRSLDPSVVKVLSSRPFASALAKGGQIQVETVAEGTATLEADVEIDGAVQTDRFEVRVEAVARVALSRGAGQMAPYSRYAGCTDDQGGAYVLADPTGHEIEIVLKKGNAKNEALRGYGVYPLKASPAESVEFKRYDELRQRLTFQPKASGQIVLTADMGGNALAFHFVTEAAVDGLLPAVFALDQQGHRSQKVNQLVQGRVFDVALFPTVQKAWLCGGDITVKREVLTPSNCSLVGDGHYRSEQLIKATNPGECRVRFVSEKAAGGRGIVFDLRLDVIPGEYADSGW